MASDSSLLYNDCQASLPGSGAVLPNTTQTPICALPLYATANSSAFQACCEGEVDTYGCWSYCTYTQGIQQFANCLVGQGDNSTALSAFCERGIVANSTSRVSNGNTESAGFRQRGTPSISLILMAALLAVFFISPTSAAIISSLADGLEKRQSSSGACTFTQDQNYTSSRRQEKVTATDATCVSSDSVFCISENNINSNIDNNNRTINGTSAAEPGYDAFFEILANATGRRFPAMSSVEMEYDFAIQSGSVWYLTFIPYAWCVNGTVTGCAGTLGETDDPTTVTACGPVFVSDGDSSIDPGDSDAIQGEFLAVLTG